MAISFILFKPKVHYGIPKRQTHVPVLSHASPSYLLKTHFNIILHLRLELPRGPFPLGLPTKILYDHFLSPIGAKCTTNLIFLDLITQIITT